MKKLNSSEENDKQVVIAGKSKKFWQLDISMKQPSEHHRAVQLKHYLKLHNNFSSLLRERAIPVMCTLHTLSSKQLKKGKNSHLTRKREGSRASERASKKDRASIPRLFLLMALALLSLYLIRGFALGKIRLRESASQCVYKYETQRERARERAAAAVSRRLEGKRRARAHRVVSLSAALELGRRALYTR